jgi:hypothetical protein
VGAIAGRILRQFRYDPRTLGLIVVVPLVVMMLIGYLIGDSGMEPLPVAVVAGASPFAPTFVRTLDGQPAIEVVATTDDETARRQVDEGDIAGAVELPSTPVERSSSWSRGPTRACRAQ